MTFNYKKLIKENIILILIMVFGLILRFYFWLSFDGFTWDEGSHSLAGILLARTILNGFDYEYFKEFTNHYWASIGSLFFFPWGYTILSTLSFLFFGFSELSARLPSMIFSLISIPAIYLLASKLFDKKIALLSAYFMAINPYFITRGGVALVDVPMSCLIILSFYFCLIAIDKEKIKYWFLAGLFCGLSGLMKPTGFIIFPFLILLAVYFKGWKYLFSKQLMIFSSVIFFSFISYFGVGLLALLVFPKLGWIKTAEGLIIFKSIFQWFGRIIPEKYFDFFGQNLVYANYGDPSWKNFYGWIYYLGLIPQQLGSYAMFIITIFGSITLFLNKKNKQQFYIISLFILFIYLIFTLIANKDARYTMPLIPFIIILSAVGIYNLYYEIKNKYRLILMSIILVTLSYLSLNDIYQSNFNNIGHNLELSIEAMQNLEPGLIVPFNETNIVNVQTISFYMAINDPGLRYSVLWPDSIDIASYIVADTATEINGFDLVLVNHWFHLWPEKLTSQKYYSNELSNL